MLKMCVLVATASLLVALPACAAQDRAPATASRLSQAAPRKTCQAEAAVDQGRLERAIPDLQRRARHVLGPAFGGLYVDPGCATVASNVSDPDKFRRIEAAFPFRANLQFKVVNFSYRELRLTQLDVIRLQLPGSSDVDVRANRVVFFRSELLSPDARRALALFGDRVQVAPGIGHDIALDRRPS